MNPRSLRFRLTAWYAAILAGAFLVAGTGAWWSIRDSIYKTVDEDLQARLIAMRQYLQKQMADTDSGPLEEELAEQSALVPAGPTYRLAGNDGRWIFRSASTQGWDTAPLRSGELPENGRIDTLRTGSSTLRVITAPVAVGTLQIGMPMNQFQQMLQRVTWMALIASPFLLALAAAGGHWMSGRALAPVDRIGRTAERIEAENLSQRLPLSGAGDELDRLSAILNSMLSRLEASFHRMHQFTADASHELRTPVAVIRTVAEVARSRSRTEEEYAAALDRVLQETERSTRLIEDLMLLARGDGGADGIVLEILDLAGVVRDACTQAKILAELSGIRLSAGEIEACTVSGDEPALRRLMLILLDNAIKYNPQGGTVSVSLNRERRGEAEQSREVAVLRVRDSGVGICPEDLPHIFERFYRASKDRSRETGGAGLGLSIAKWIVARHNGEFHVESSVGAGSLFQVRLPLSSNHS